VGGRKGEEGKPGCETGSIKFGFKSDSSVGALAAVPCVRDHGFPPILGRHAHRFSAAQAVPVTAERRAAEDMQLPFHPVRPSS